MSEIVTIVFDSAKNVFQAHGAQLISGSNQIVSAPRRLSASLQAGQFPVLQVAAVGLLMHPSYHSGFARRLPHAICTTESSALRLLLRILSFFTASTVIENRGLRGNFFSRVR